MNQIEMKRDQTTRENNRNEKKKRSNGSQSTVYPKLIIFHSNSRNSIAVKHIKSKLIVAFWIS